MEIITTSNKECDLKNKRKKNGLVVRGCELKKFPLSELSLQLEFGRKLK
jgi:hypothetical protein